MSSEKREVTGRRRGEGRRRTEELVRVTRVTADVFNFAGNLSGLESNVEQRCRSFRMHTNYRLVSLYVPSLIRQCSLLVAAAAAFTLFT